MDRNALQEMLRTLHAELEGGPPVDAATRELLVNVLDDIRGALEHAPEPGDAPAAPAPAPAPSAEHHTLAERLKDATGHLEESHPRLTWAVEEIADALASIFR